MTTKRRNVYRCEWCRGEVTEDIEYVPSCGDRGYCEVCGQTVTLLERREPLPEQARVERDDSGAAESTEARGRGGGSGAGLSDGEFEALLQDERRVHAEITSGQRRRRQVGGLGR